jgi:hypothetical protein
MIVSNSRQSSRKGKQTRHNTKPQAKKQVSPLCQRMIRDMELAGLTHGTQQNYIRAVMMLQEHYAIRPDKLTEKQVQQYIFWLRDEKKVAKGTFQSNWAGIKSSTTIPSAWTGRSSHVRRSANPYANGYRCPLPGRTTGTG